MPSSPKLSVFVATPSTNGNFPIQTLMSMLDTQEAAYKYGVQIEFGFVTCTLVHHARTLLANVFLDRKKDFDRLFFIDSDMSWTPVDFMKVLTKTEKHPIVVGVYPRRNEEGGYYVSFPPGTENDPPDEDGLTEIDATGLGFACISRDVMERLAADSPKLKYNHADEPMPSIFRMDDNNGVARGEDYAFWADVKAAGYKIMADATVKLGHVGTKVYEMKCSV
jgi:hypothetical protein